MIIIATMVVAALGFYGWALSATGYSSFARSILWKDSDTGDQFRFPSRDIKSGSVTSVLTAGRSPLFNGDAAIARAGDNLEHFLEETDTTAFLVIHKDKLVYEKYFSGVQPESLQTSFSVAKSFLSTLVGIAIDEGKIKSVNEPITTYIPELTQRDERFKLITLHHLLSMSSGIRYNEEGTPWSDDTVTYYGTDLRNLALQKTSIKNTPGELWLYNNYNPLLVGLILERAVGTSVSDYMSKKLWQPLGAEQDATWSLDSEKSGFEKMESGLNVSPRDYARFGQLMLREGLWQDKQIVSREWLKIATSDINTSRSMRPYGYFWWVDPRANGSYFAAGNHGQFIYISPATQTVIVRTAKSDGASYETWHTVFRDIARQLGTLPDTALH